jgi:hypothetical protein
MFRTNLVGQIKTRILRSITFFGNRAVYVEEWCRAGQVKDGYITRRMHFACWITKAPDTHSEFIILLAFPQQQWFREGSLAL